jgi:hypothetical protein
LWIKYCNKHGDNDGIVPHILTFKNGYLITNKGDTFALRVLLQKRRQYNLETHLPFFSLRKGFARSKKKAATGHYTGQNYLQQL